MSRPLISVILPAFEAQASIYRCLRSVCATALAPHQVEFLIEPDDGQSYDWLRVEGFALKVGAAGPVRSGPGAARNRALGRATGEWITYVDADDHVAPGYLEALLEGARRHGAGLAQTRVQQAGALVLHYGRAGAALRFDDWAQTGVSVRGMFQRESFGRFADFPAQDVLHIVEATLRHGQYLRFCSAEYVLELGRDTVTTQPGFKAEVAVAYAQSIPYLQRHYQDSPLLAEAVAFWHAKAALNRAYLKSGAGQAFYTFAAARAQEG